MTIALLLACGPPPPPAPTASPPPTGDSGAVAPPVSERIEVWVTLDGEPVEGAWVGIGGGDHAYTGPDGRAQLWLGDGDRVIASHPEARTLSVPATDGARVELTRFATEDNPAYVFQDPGIPGERGTTAQCGHCHASMLVDWAASPHRTSASNPVVHDVFAGTSRHTDADACAQAGGRWLEGLEPGTRVPTGRCYLGAGTLPDLNPHCGDTVSCDTVATDTGGCADCHAPGIDGPVGGRSLLDATGRAYSEGIHCDVCHKVERVDLGAAPGIAGALQLLRPSEPSTMVGFDWAPLTFGPLPDVPNPRMGAVPREHFREAVFCAGCHESVQPALIPGQSLDPARWPDGLPVHSTYSEWAAGPYAPESPCQSCHMPPETRYGNAADLDLETPLIGVASGWFRAPGATRRHLWDGPRGDGPLLRLAAALDLETRIEEDDFVVDVTTTNVGAGHAIPTGEPMRSMILVVEARCDGEPLAPSGGDVVPDFGGALDQKAAGEDWTRWPGAQVGQLLRVVEEGPPRDYTGPLRFGDGSFSPEEKGLRVERYVGTSTIVGLDGDRVLLDRPLPEGDRVYRVDGAGLPDDGEPSRAWAGAPGFAFARVLVDAENQRQVPHHRAVDIAVDNRIPPLSSVTTTHRFSSDCAAPTAHARLIHRPYPLREAHRRGWDAQDRLMAEVMAP